MTKRMVVSVPEGLIDHVKSDMEADKLAGRRASAAGSLVRLAAIGAARLAAEDAQSRELDAWLARHDGLAAAKFAAAKAAGWSMTTAEAMAAAAAEMEAAGDSYEAATERARAAYDRANSEALRAIA